MPRISIIIPVYKAEQYLYKCLDSILLQTFKDWECLLIDDGSPDKSGGICDKYAAGDDRFVVFHKDNAGVSAARNYGLEKAQGEWIIFVDSDDWIDCNCLQNCIGIAERFSVDIVQFGYRKVKFSGEVISEHLYECRCSKAAKYSQSRNKNVCVGGSLIRSALIRNNHIRFKEGVKYAEDQMFVMNCMKFSERIMYHNAIYYNYHINLQSAVHNAKLQDKILSCFEIESFVNGDKFYGIWKDNLFFSFYIDFITNYNVDAANFKSIQSQFNVNVMNLYGLKRKLIYIMMSLYPSVAIKFIKLMIA